MPPAGVYPVSIFKACDIRGIYGTELDTNTALLLGKAIGTRNRGKQVAVAGDLRVSTPALLEGLIRGLRDTGADVVDLGLVATPVFYFGKDLLQAEAGVMVTASHNPGQYNGFKVILGELPVIPEDLAALANEMHAGMFCKGSGSVRQVSVQEAYASQVIASFPGLTSRRVVVDAGNGSCWDIAPRVLTALGQEVIPLFCEPDGRFPNRDPNPAIPEHLRDLRRRTVETGAALGIAFDGDGDRVVFVDELGEVQSADRVLVLFIRSLLRRYPGAKVVYDLKSSSVVEREVRENGGQPIAERSGHAFIKRRLMTELALLGGEISGHYFFGVLKRDDAIYAAALLLQVLDECGMTLSQAMHTVPVYATTPDIRIPCAPDVARHIIDELAAGLYAYQQDRLDGIRVVFPEGWGLARVSVTEPLITLRFEANNADELVLLQERFRQASQTLASIWQT